jgi:dTDP-4-amino-4,6-dideoxygalactose transaminase
MRRGTPAWLPALHCGVEVQAVIAAGFRPRFYDQDERLAPDPSELEAAMSHAPGPVLLTHFFGRTQPTTRRVAELCRRHGQLLVEDTSHALPWRPSCDGVPGDEAEGDRGLRTARVGAIRAGSVRKVLGTVDGGVLSVDRAAVRRALGREFVAPPPRRPAVWPWLVLGRRKLGHSVGDAEPPGSVGPATHSPRSWRRAMSPLSRRALAVADPEAIARRRRDRWGALRDGLGDLLPPSALPLGPGEGDAPLCLVVRVEERDRLARTLLGDGVDAYVFGRHPHPVLPPGFPGAARHRATLLGIPCHHGLTPADLDRLAEILRRRLPGYVATTGSRAG